MKFLRRFASAVSRRLFRRPPPHRPIWAGVYAGFSDIPASGEGFNSHDAATAAEQLLRETQAEPMPYEAVLDHQLLLLATRLTGLNTVRVVDFGGGVGQSYAALRRLVSPELGLRYCVVDLASAVQHGRTLWPASGEIVFAEELHAVPFTPDVVFAKGAIQYSDDYAEILRRLFAMSPQWLVVEKASLLIGHEYATEQLNVYESRIPYWFMDLKKLERVANECGYRLVLQRRLEREYDQSNFPPELRIGRAASLLFERESR